MTDEQWRHFTNFSRGAKRQKLLLHGFYVSNLAGLQILCTPYRFLVFFGNIRIFSWIFQFFGHFIEGNRPALLTYTVAGDSSKKQSLKILNAISEYADILELGVPHNTPVADGSQIQTSSYRAIKNGIKVKDCLLYTSPSPRDKRQSRMPSSA